MRAIDDAMDIVSRDWRFTKDAQRAEILHLFNEGRKVYANLARVG